MRPKSASGRPARFKKLENIDAPNNNAKSFAVSPAASLETSNSTPPLRLPFRNVINKAPAAPIPAASVAESSGSAVEAEAGVDSITDGVLCLNPSPEDSDNESDLILGKLVEKKHAPPFAKSRNSSRLRKQSRETEL